MGFLALQWFKSLHRHRQRRRRRIRALNGSIAPSRDKRKGSPCQQDAHGDSHGAKRMMCSISTPTLPEDILHHIYSLLPLRDAALAVCSSHAFLRFWRCRSVLVLNSRTLGSNANAPQDSFNCIIDNILRNHSGNIKIFKLECIFDAFHYLDCWLRIAVTPGIQGLTLNLCYGDQMKYNVPCTLLSDGVRNSIDFLELSFCAFRPTADLGHFKKLKSLLLCSMCISDDELECFLSNSPALEKLELDYCQELMCLKIPCMLLQLHSMRVSSCFKLRVIESKARNLSSKARNLSRFILRSGEGVKVSLGETLQMKNLCMGRSNLISYTRVKLPSNMPNLETLSISSDYERVNTPMVSTKFLFLKRLSISLIFTFYPSYDYFSLVSFLDASPCLETWLLDVALESMPHESVFGGSSQLRQIPEQNHGCLKTVRFTGFNSAKSLVELTCYILRNATSLDQLTLDTTYGDPKCDNPISGGRCARMNKGFLMEARNGVAAIRTYIVDKVPSTVKLTVVEHCARCHAGTLSE